MSDYIDSRSNYMPGVAEIDRTCDYLRVNADVGGGRLKVAGSHVRVGHGAASDDVDIIQIQNLCDEMNQVFILTYDANNENPQLRFGKREVDDWLENHPGDSHRVITDFKLAACKDHWRSPSVAKFYRAIRDDTELPDFVNWQEFMTLYFKELRQRILRWYATSSPKGIHYSAEYWFRLAIELTVTVPALWDHETRSMYVNAAYDAGFSNIRLLLEPLCAAALIARWLLQLGYIRYGDVLAFLDRGHVTGDRAAVRVNEPASPEQVPELEIVGPIDGDMLGAHVMHDMACDRVRNKIISRYGSMEDVLSRLGDLPEEVFFRTLEKEMDFRKEQHPVEAMNVRIYGTDTWPEKEGGLRFVDIELDKYTMKEINEHWAKRVLEADSQWLRRPQIADAKAIILVGGGNNNMLLVDKLQALAKDLGMKCFPGQSKLAVARGGLMQYPVNMADVLPRGCYYYAREKVFDKGVHRDVGRRRRINPKDPHSKMEVVPNQALFRPNRNVDGELVMRDWLALMLDNRKAHKVESTCLAMDYAFEVGHDDNLSLNLYFSPQHHGVDVPLRDRDGNRRPEFTPFQRQFATIDIDMAQWEQVYPQYQLDGKTMFDVKALLELQLHHDSLDLQITVLEPGEEVVYKPNCLEAKSGKRRRGCTEETVVDSTAPYKVLFKTTRRLWDAYRTHRIDNDLPQPRPAPRSRARHRPEVTATSRHIMNTRRGKVREQPSDSEHGAPADLSLADGREHIMSEASTQSTGDVDNNTTSPSLPDQTLIEHIDSDTHITTKSDGTTPSRRPSQADRPNHTTSHNHGLSPMMTSSEYAQSPASSVSGNIGTFSLQHYCRAYMRNWSEASNAERAEWLRQQNLVGRPSARPMSDPIRETSNTAQTCPSMTNRKRRRSLSKQERLKTIFEDY